MSDKPEAVKTTVTLKLFVKLLTFFAVVLGGAAGPSWYVANSFASEKWASRTELVALEERVDLQKERSTRLLRRMDIMLCEQRHGKDAWNLHADKCSVDLGFKD